MDDIAEEKGLQTYGRIEEKNQFIDLRAKGYSYSKIAKELGISKGTLTQWNEELKADITRLKCLQLEELYTKYLMSKEARIKLLGGSLEKVNEEIERRDFTTLPLDKLLDFQVRLIKELKDEYIDPQRDIFDTKLNANGIVAEFLNLLARVRSGEITKEQAYKESYILTSLLRAYEANTVEEKLDNIEALVGRK